MSGYYARFKRERSWVRALAEPYCFDTLTCVSFIIVNSFTIIYLFIV